MGYVHFILYNSFHRHRLCFRHKQISMSSNILKLEIYKRTSCTTLIFIMVRHYRQKKNCSFFSKANDDSTKTAHFDVKSVKIVMAHCGTSDRTHEYNTKKKTHRIRIIYDIKDRTHSNCTSKAKKDTTTLRTALSNDKMCKSW